MMLEYVVVAIFQLDLNRPSRKRNGAESRREDILHRLLSSHGRNTYSHALTMQLLKVEVLDDIVQRQVRVISFPTASRTPILVVTWPGRPSPASPSLSILLNLSTPSSPRFA
jgi:hypothetical protein